MRDPPRGRLRARPGRRRGGDHAADEGAVPRLSVQPDRRRPARRRPGRARRGSPSATTCSSYSDEIYDRLAYGDVPPSGVQRAARDARADDPHGRLLQGLRDDRLAGRLPRRAGRDPRGDRQGPPVRDHVGADDGPGRRARGDPPRRGGRGADASPSTTAGAGSSSTASTRSACGRSSRAGAFYAFPEVTSATGLSSRGVRRAAAHRGARRGHPRIGLRAVRRGPRPGVLRDLVRAARGSARPDRPLRGAPGERSARLMTQTTAPASRALERYEAVIGIEVHCQLKTASKMFCGCSTDYDGAAPNTHVCPVCLGLPGALPTINRRAVEHVLATGVAIGATTPDATRWDRKNYFYPDLPKGYQISQYDLPLASAGRLTVETSEGPVTIGITRAHLEEDTAKLIHATADDGRKVSLVDFNRSGAPAHGDRHRARRPVRGAGAPLRRGAAAAAPGDRRVRCGHGARPDARRGERLAPAARDGAVRDAGRGQEHELVPLRRAGDRVRDRAPGRGARRRRDAHPGDARLGREPRRDVRDALQGGLARLPLLPGAGPAAAPRRRGLARRDPARRCRSCRPRDEPATRPSSGCRRTTRPSSSPSRARRSSSRAHAWPEPRSTPRSSPTG